VCVVTVGTLRIIFVARGQTILAPILGFVEVSSWLFAIGLTMQNLDNWTCCIGFALGFALGNWLGIVIEKWLALGAVTVRVITHCVADPLIAALRGAGFGVTTLAGQGASGTVQIVMTVVKRTQLAEVITLIETHQPGAFYAIEEVQSASEGVFPALKERPRVVPLPLARMLGIVSSGSNAR
jgi:uncharacterized protein YebE (UPF0316 family)